MTPVYTPYSIPRAPYPVLHSIPLLMKPPVFALFFLLFLKSASNNSPYNFFFQTKRHFLTLPYTFPQSPA
jgi:hypothetical protein